MSETSAEKGLVLLTKAFYEAHYHVKDAELSAQILTLMHTHIHTHDMTMEDLHDAQRKLGYLKEPEEIEELPEDEELTEEEERLLLSLLDASGISIDPDGPRALYQQDRFVSIYDPKSIFGHKKRRMPRLDEIDRAAWASQHTPGNPNDVKAPLLIGGYLVKAHP